MQENELKLKLISQLLSIKTSNKGIKNFREVFYNDFLKFIDKESFLFKTEVIFKLQKIEEELRLISAYPKLYIKNNIALGGGYSAGKSEFISSFIKSSLKLPRGVIPTTAIPTYVVNEEKDILLGCSKNGGTVDLEKIDKDFYKQLSHNFIKSFEFNLKDIMPYVIVGTKLEYENICFIDTPGYNPADINEGFTNEDISTAKKFLEDVNIIIWLIGADASGVISANDIDFLNSLNLKDKKLYVVYNKADLKNVNELEEVLEIIEEVLQERDINFEGISAYSSVMKKEFIYIKKSLKEFLEENNMLSYQHSIYSELRNIYLSFKRTIKKQQKEKQKILKLIHSISLDILEEMGKSNIIEKLDKLKMFYLEKEDNLEANSLIKLKDIFEKFKKSVDMVFDKKNDVDIFYEDLYIKMKNGLYGLINEFNEWVIEPEYDDIDELEEGLYKAKKYDKYGLIGMSGNIILNFEYDDIIRLDEGAFKIKKDYSDNILRKLLSKKYKYGLLDKKGTIILKPEFNEVVFLGNGLFRIKKDNKYGLVTKEGKVILECKYDYINKLNNNLFEIKKGAKYEIIDNNGNCLKQLSKKRIEL